MANENIGEGTGQQPGGNGDNNTGGAGASAGDTGRSNTGAGNGQPQEKVYSYKEDRTDWVPRHRLNEQGGKLTAAEKRIAELEAAHTQAEKRVRALAGVEPQDPREVEFNELKSVLTKMFPGLGRMENLTEEQMERLMRAAETAEQSSNASWERHALGMYDELESETARLMGTDKLTPRQQEHLRSAYARVANQNAAERLAAFQRGERPTVQTIASDRDFIARHEQGDRSQLVQFAKEFADDWFEPARRSVSAAQARRNMRPVPGGGGRRTIATTGAQKVDLNTEDGFKKALLEARQTSTE